MTGGIDWQTIGQAIGLGLTGCVVGAGSVGLWVRKQFVENARQGAEVDVIQMMRDEMARLSARQLDQERRELRLIRHIYNLEAIMRAAGLNPPLFDIDSDTLQAGEPR